MYRLARGCLPIMYRQFTTDTKRGVCPFCQSREDSVHVFSQCAVPKALLQRIADLFKLPGVSYRTVRFLHPLPSHAVNQFVLLLVECLYQVWLARCEAIFTGRAPSLYKVLAKSAEGGLVRCFPGAVSPRREGVSRSLASNSSDFQ